VRAPPFTALASVYDTIMQDVPYAAWVDFALTAAERRGWRGGRVLELGCGTGNATRLLEARGLRVVAVDASPAMLDVARAKLRHATLLQGDIRDVALPGRFSLALGVFDVVNNLLEDGAMARLARHVLSHLEPGGVWAFDANTSVGLEALWGGEVVEGWAGEVHYRWRHHWDAAARLATVEAWCQGPDGVFTEEHRERPYDPDELRDLLTDAGFARVDVVRYPSGAAADEDDPRVWAFASAPSRASHALGERSPSRAP
jgi:SAM-dependent methyltransferase